MSVWQTKLTVRDLPEESAQQQRNNSRKLLHIDVETMNLQTKYPIDFVLELLKTHRSS